MWNHCFHNEICITLCFHLVLRGRVGGWSVAESERKKGGWSLGVLRGGPSAAKQVTVLDGPHVTLILLCVYVYKRPDQDRVWLHSLPTHTGQIKPRASHNSVYGPSDVYQIYFMSDNLRDIGPNDGPLDWQIVVCNGFIYKLLVRILVCMSVGIWSRRFMTCLCMCVCVRVSMPYVCVYVWVYHVSFSACSCMVLYLCVCVHMSVALRSRG